MGAVSIPIGSFMGESAAREEMVCRVLSTGPSPEATRVDLENLVVAELDKLTAYEVCCILGALRNRLGKDLPLVQIYELAVRSIVDRVREMVDAPA